MDGQRFEDALRAACSSTISRRQPLRMLVGTLLGSLTGLAGLQAASAACRANGKRCGSATQCCSGVCKKNRRADRNKLCRPSPRQGTCTIEQDACQSTSTICNDDPSCNCQIRLNGSSVCSLRGTCFDCAKDSDCPAETFGEGAICVQCAGCGATGSRGCVGRCPTRV